MIIFSYTFQYKSINLYFNVYFYYHFLYIFLDFKYFSHYFKTMKETLKKLRTDNRYSQDLLAKILGVSRISYLKYESGEVEPPVEIVRKLAKIYKVSYRTLIDNELNKENASVSYSYDYHKQLSVASPTPAYGTSFYSEESFNSPNIVSQFAEMLSELQNTIVSLQSQIASLQKSPTFVAGSFQKSATFNKEDFFAQVGKVQIDPTYIDELRGASLI